MVTNGAMFMARAFHNAYQRAEQEADRTTVSGWDSLSEGDRKVIAEAFQMLLDIGVLSPITMQGVRALRIAGLIPMSHGVQGS